MADVAPPRSASDVRPRVEHDRPRVVHDDSEPMAPRPVLGGAVVGGLWCVVMGLVVVGIPVLLVWALTPGPAAHPGDALHATASVWLVANLVPLHLAAGPFGLLPLGLVAVPAVLLTMVGRWAARATRPEQLSDALLLSCGLAVAYAIGASLVAAWSRTPGVHASPFAAFAAPLLLALLATTWSVLRTTGLTDELLALVPAPGLEVLRAAAASLAVLLAAAAAMAGLAFALRLPEADDLAGATRPGVLGGVMLVVLSIAYVPNAVVWAASYAVGPGFAVGVGTSVAPAGASLGPVPAFPLLAALPGPGGASALSVATLLVPVAAGVFGGAVLSRRMQGPSRPPTHVAAWAALGGAAAGVGLGLLAALSGGPLGTGRLAAVGPSAWQVGLSAIVLLAASAAGAGWLTARRAARR